MLGDHKGIGLRFNKAVDWVIAKMRFKSTPSGSSLNLWMPSWNNKQERSPRVPHSIATWLRFW